VARRIVQLPSSFPLAVRALKRARPLLLPPNAPIRDAVFAAAQCSTVETVSSYGGERLGDLTLPQPIDCLMEGPIA